MKDLLRAGLLILATAVLLPTVATAQPPTRTHDRPAYTTTADLGDVRPFLAWIQDAVITEGIDIEPVAEFSNLDLGNRLFAGARAAWWTMPRLELGARFGMFHANPDGAPSVDGASDPLLYGRYRLADEPGWPALAFGGGFDVPVGDEDVGEGTFDVHAFAAARQEVESGIELLANLQFESREVGDGRENGFRLGGGAIFPITDELAAIAEFTLGTREFSALMAGFDLELPPGGHLRGGLALGLDDVAPDYTLIFGIAFPVY